MTNSEIKLTKNFQKQVTNSILAIGVFIFVYILIISLCIGFTSLSIYWAIKIIKAYPMIFIILFGIGLISLGILTLIFLLKFLFQPTKYDRSRLLEIYPNKEPELFKLIEEVAKEVGTKFPKSVYISPEVNASVFYDSSFWSMVLPVNKNLQIGMGLITSVTKEELKAILAHEFGHFSQKSMKIGSYVYFFNQMMYNMLYQNQSYERISENWERISSYFAFFALIAVKVNNGIQWILIRTYWIVNRNYQSLSREMEFHADEIAASITGPTPLINSLLRLESINYSFENTLQFYSLKQNENLRSKNLYKDLKKEVELRAHLDKQTIKNGLLEISPENGSFFQSKLIIKDQWASHPPLAERIDRLNKFKDKNEGSSDLAELLFSDIEKTQEKITFLLFKNSTYQNEIKDIDTSEFIELYRKNILEYSFSTIYNKYYDNKNPSQIAFDTLIKDENKAINFDELFSKEQVEKVYKSLSLQHDIQLLDDIQTNRLPLKSFEYDGKKFQRKEAKLLSEKLLIEMNQIISEIKINDEKIYRFFIGLEMQRSNPQQLNEKYEKLLSFDRIFEEKMKIYNKMVEDLAFVSVTNTFDQIEKKIDKIYAQEIFLKQEIRSLLDEENVKENLPKESIDTLEKYLSKRYEYFYVDHYNDSSLEILYAALNQYPFLLNQKYFMLKKDLLNYQESLLAENKQ